MNQDPFDVGDLGFPPPRRDDELPVREVAQVLASALLGLDDDRTVLLVVRLPDGRDVVPARARYDPGAGTLTLELASERRQPPTSAPFTRETASFTVDLNLTRERRLDQWRRLYGLDLTSQAHPDPLRGVDLRATPADRAGEPPATGAGDR